MLNQNWSVRCWKLGLGFLAIGGIIVNFGNCALAQIVGDDTLGSESYFFAANLFINSNHSDQIGVKAIQNTNLFHKYSELKTEAIIGKDEPQKLASKTFSLTSKTPVSSLANKKQQVLRASSVWYQPCPDPGIAPDGCWM